MADKYNLEDCAGIKIQFPNGKKGIITRFKVVNALDMTAAEMWDGEDFVIRGEEKFIKVGNGNRGETPTIYGKYEGRKE